MLVIFRRCFSSFSNKTLLIQRSVWNQLESLREMKNFESASLLCKSQPRSSSLNNSTSITIFTFIESINHRRSTIRCYLWMAFVLLPKETEEEEEKRLFYFRSEMPKPGHLTLAVCRYSTSHCPFHLIYVEWPRCFHRFSWTQAQLLKRKKLVP